MDKSGYTLIGTLAKLHGFKGALVLITDTTLPTKLCKWESVFIEIDKLPVPFFISSCKLISESAAQITFDDISTPEQARELVGLNVLQEDKVLGKTQQKRESTGLVNYKVYDAQAGYIGTIDSIEEYSQNILFRILNNSQEILIPAIDEFIVKIDSQKKELYIQTPQGLIDLNS